MIEFEPKATLRTMKIIYFGLLAGPTIFIIMTLLVVKEKFIISFEPSDPLQLVLIVLFLAIIPVSIIIPKKKLSQINPEDSLQSKLTSFQSALIIKSALWVGVANFGIVISLISANLFPISFAIFSLLFIASFYPGVNSIEKTIGLNSSEIKLLSN